MGPPIGMASGAPAFVRRLQERRARRRRCTTRRAALADGSGSVWIKAQETGRWSLALTGLPAVTAVVVV
jgi:hypothetical protein